MDSIPRYNLRKHPLQPPRVQRYLDEHLFPHFTATLDNYDYNILDQSQSSESDITFEPSTQSEPSVTSKQSTEDSLPTISSTNLWGLEVRTRSPTPGEQATVALEQTTLEFRPAVKLSVLRHVFGEGRNIPPSQSSGHPDPRISR